MPNAKKLTLKWPTRSHMLRWNPKARSNQSKGTRGEEDGGHDAGDAQTIADRGHGRGHG